MKRIFSFFLLPFTLLFAVNATAQWTQITNFSGTQTYNGIGVTVTSTGAVAAGGGECFGVGGLNYPNTPYWAASGGPGQYTFTFSSPVVGAELTMEGLNTGEIATVAINGAQTYISNCESVPGFEECPSGNTGTLVIENGVVYGPSTPNSYGGIELGFVPPGGINSITVWCDGSLAGIDFYMAFTTLPNVPIFTYPGNNFYVCETPACTGANMEFYFQNSYPNATVETMFGDGTSDNEVINGNTVSLNHAYAAPGTYTIKSVEYSNGVPVDSLLYSYNYLFCNSYSINYYLDENINCINDIGDYNIMQPITTEIDSNGVPIDTIISTTGFYYTAYGVAGDVYKFKVISLPPTLQLECPLSGIVTETLQAGFMGPNVENIGFVCPNNVTDFDLQEYAVFHAGRHSGHGFVLVTNPYCDAVNATLSATFSNAYNFLDATPAPSSQNQNNITWLLNGVGQSNNYSPLAVFDVEVPGAWLTTGDTVSSSYSVTPTAGDVNTGNNTSVLIDTVDGSWDPNHMMVSPSGIIAAGTQLTYFTEFENTGNDTAINIHVMDTLSDNVDIKTLQVAGNSAPMKLDVIKYNGHNILKFDFPNINLLDSSHHGLCDGVVIFKINAKSGLPYGTTIYNHAGIYFDYNPVVMTDTVLNIIGWPSAVPAVSNAAVAVYPNPASNELTVKADNAIYTSYTITNSVGQSLLYSTLNATQTKVDISKLPAGVYYISLKSDNGSVVKKFVKM